MSNGVGDGSYSDSVMKFRNNLWRRVDISQCFQNVKIETFSSYCSFLQPRARDVGLVLGKCNPENRENIELLIN